MARMLHSIPRRRVIAGMAAFGLWGLAPRLPAAESGASKSPARPLADRLAAYADGLRHDDLDAATIERVKAHFIDTIGCGIAAFDERPVRVCRDVALVAAGGAATVIGTKRRTTPDLATFANGAAFRYYDLNDSYVGGLAGHPSDHIAACLAVAESERSSAAELITAIVLAYEINCRMIDAFDITTRGWDVPVFSLPAVALAAGKLMKLPPAQLARAGLTGPAPIFEGNSGFFKQISGPADVDVSAFGRRGVPFRIHQCGIKAYPAVVYAQTAVVAGVEVARKAGSLDRIAAIEIATTRRGYQRAGSEPEKWTPDTRETADHSLPYITARAMFDGDITNDSYLPAKLREPRILAFMRKITVKEDPALTARVGAMVPTRVTAILADGQHISSEVDDVPGFPGRPMSRAEVERKFRGNVGKI